MSYLMVILLIIPSISALAAFLTVNVLLITTVLREEYEDSKVF